MKCHLIFAQAITATVQIVRTRAGAETVLEEHEGTGIEWFDAPQMAIRNGDLTSLRIVYDGAGALWSDPDVLWGDPDVLWSSGAAAILWGIVQITDFEEDSPTTPVSSWSNVGAMPNSVDEEGLTWDGSLLWTIDDTSTAANLHAVSRTAPGTVVDSISARCELPRGIAWDGSNFWIVDEDQGEILRVAADGTSTVLTVASPGSDPYGMTWDGANPWHSDRTANTLYKLDPSNGSVLATLSVGSQPLDMGWDGRWLWVVFAGDNSVKAINPSSGAVVRSVDLPEVITVNGNGDPECGATVAEGSLYVVPATDLWRLSEL